MAYQLAVLYFAAFIAHGIFLAGSAFVATQFKVRIITVKLGVGPKLISRGKFVLCLLPISGFVRMHDTRSDGDDNVEQAFDWQPRLVRVLTQLSGPLALLLATVLLRGTAGWESFLRGFGQLFSGAIAPASRGVELAGGYLHVSSEAGFVAALGVLLAKMAAANFMPFPSLGGGAALFELFSPSGDSPARDKIWAWAQQIGLVAILALLLPWLYAVTLAMWRS